MTNSRCTHKIARRSKLAWSEMVIFRLRIFALQLELCSGLWTFATYKHLAEWRLKHNGLMKWIQTKWLFQNICSQFDLTQTQSTLSDLSAWLRVSLEVPPSSSSSHLLRYSADGSKCINFSVQKFSFGSPNFTSHLEKLQLAPKWWFVQYLARRWTLLSNEAKTWLTQI